MYPNTFFKGMAILKGEKHRYASGCLLAGFHGKYEQQRPELNEVKAYSPFVPLVSLLTTFKLVCTALRMTSRSPVLLRNGGFTPKFSEQSRQKTLHGYPLTESRY